ncbi:MAG: Biotin carboxylase [Spirochaetes bacterium ADurb.Bin315]|nr:MAG: Biotin carboxylase [Spirochaetes bacterium ADurb.Bin315]
MIRRILVANRGEIALRIVRACKDLGIESVVVYSEADRDTLAVRHADRSVCIGPAPSSESYLNVRSILSAAILTRCDALHPGVGFLSESASFAKAVEEAGLIFIGPRPETIELLGNKVQARISAERAGLPVTPGSDRLDDLVSAKKWASRLGYPVILKASAGGGGRGMRIIHKETELESNFLLAKKEALLFFGDDSMYMEKFLQNPRHVEVQLLGDGNGNVLHLGERDCSVQRNHQKLVEETPSPILDNTVREVMTGASATLFQNLAYRGAGTVEFLIEGGAYYFMEVNARLQVEHPISEAVSGVDLVVEQIRIASKKGISRKQNQVVLRGYSLECRINGLGAGRIARFDLPSGPHVRTDTFLASGMTLSPYYDSLLAKIIVHAPSRQEGIDRMLRALDEVVIEGISVNVEEQKMIIGSPSFRSGRFGTDLYETLCGKEMRHG